MNTDWLKKLHKSELEILDEFVRVCDENNLNYFLFGGTLLGAYRHKGYIPWDDDIDICMPIDDFNLFVNKYYKFLADKFRLDYITTNKDYWLCFAKIRNKETEFIEPLLQNCKTNCGIFIDIFPIYTFKEENLERTYQRMDKIKSIKYSLVARNLYDFSYMKQLKNPIKKVWFILKKILPNKLFFIALNKLTKCDKFGESQFFVNCVGDYTKDRETEPISDYFPSKKILFEGKEYNAPSNVEHILSNKYGNDFMVLPPVEERRTHEPIKIKFENGEEIFFNKK